VLIWVGIQYLQHTSLTFQRWLTYHHIQMSWCYLTISTEHGTNWLLKTGRTYYKQLQIWFCLGSLISIIGLIASSVLLIYSLYQYSTILLASEDTEDEVNHAYIDT